MPRGHYMPSVPIATAAVPTLIFPKANKSKREETPWGRKSLGLKNWEPKKKKKFFSNLVDSV